MVKRDSLITIILFLILLFSPQTISAQSILYSNNQIIFLEVLGLNSTDNLFMINQELQFPVQKAPTSSENSCTRAVKSSFKFKDPFRKIFSIGNT